METNENEKTTDVELSNGRMRAREIRAEMLALASNQTWLMFALIFNAFLWLIAIWFQSRASSTEAGQLMAEIAGIIGAFAVLILTIVAVVLASSHVPVLYQRLR